MTGKTQQLAKASLVGEQQVVERIAKAKRQGSVFNQHQIGKMKGFSFVLSAQVV
jgi:hypothetical protein